VPLRLSAAKLAKVLRVPVSRVANIASERSAISADMARRLARYFGERLSVQPQAPEFTIANSGSTVTCGLAAATFR
jgi:transcriptional regulator with XRE-family HTH domain